MEPEITKNESVPEKKSQGALLGSIVIVLIIIIGGIYIWNSQIREVLESQPAVTSDDQTELENLVEDLGELESSIDGGLEFDLEDLE